MLDLTQLQAPIFGDKDSGLAFVRDALKLYEDALTAYSGKAESKGETKVSKILETVKSEDESAVKSADIILTNLRQMLVHACNENPNVAVALFDEGGLDDIVKVVRSWRTEATVTVESESTDDEDRDLVAEYEALNNARTMIQGTFMAWGLDPSQLPAKYVGQKKERVEGKNIPTGDLFLKFPGKLTSPNTEGTGNKAGREPVSFSFSWTIVDHEGNESFPKNVTVTRLARLCSTEYDLLSFADLKERLDNRKWMDKDTTEIVVPVPRGKLIGKRVQK